MRDFGRISYQQATEFFISVHGTTEHRLAPWMGLYLWCAREETQVDDEVFHRSSPRRFIRFFNDLACRCGLDPVTPVSHPRHVWSILVTSPVALCTYVRVLEFGNGEQLPRPGAGVSGRNRFRSLALHTG